MHLLLDQRELGAAKALYGPAYDVWPVASGSRMLPDIPGTESWSGESWSSVRLVQCSNGQAALQIVQ